MSPMAKPSRMLPAEAHTEGGKVPTMPQSKKATRPSSVRVHVHSKKRERKEMKRMLKQKLN